MCKKANRFFPVLMACYFGGAYLINFLFSNIAKPSWFSLIASQLLVLVPGLIFVLVEKISVPKCIPYRLIGPVDVLMALMIGYATIPIMLFLNYVSMLFSTNKIQATTSVLTQYPFWMQIIFIAVIPAFVEEFIFRGIFYHSYRKNGILGAAVLSGLIFGVMHLNINQFVYAFVLGVFFALLVEATGSMFTSMLVHFAINTYSITMLQIIPDAVENSAQANAIIQESSVQTTMMVICLLGIFAVAFGMISFVLFRGMAVRNNRWEHLKSELKKGFRPQNGERFVTPTLVVTLLLCAAYMIYSEYF